MHERRPATVIFTSDTDVPMCSLGDRHTAVIGDTLNVNVSDGPAWDWKNPEMLNSIRHPLECERCLFVWAQTMIDNVWPTIEQLGWYAIVN